MKKVLLVSNDDSFRIEAANMLRAIGHQAQEASDGEKAMMMIKSEAFDLVVAEVHVPKMSGIELSKWTQENGGVPVVLVSGYAGLETMSSSNSADFAGFLAKPFRADEVERLLAGIFSHEPASTSGLDDNFCKVSVSDFTNGEKINFSVYHRLDKNKYVKIAHRGDDLESSRLGNYRAKGLKDFYLAKIDFAKFVNPSLDLSKDAGSKKIPLLQKEKFLVFTQSLIKRQILVEGVDQAVFESASNFVQTILRLVAEQPKTFNLLQSLNRHADHLYAHALGVAVYGVMLAREIGWNTSPVLYKVSMAGFFHDVGMKMIPKDLTSKNRHEMIYKDRDIYDTHPRLSMELLKQTPGISEEVLIACLQHHEDCLGQGYPQKLMSAQIVPVARLIGLVDAFCELTIAIPGKSKLSAVEAIEQLVAKGRAFDPDFVSGLKMLFGIEGSSALKKAV